MGKWNVTQLVTLLMKSIYPDLSPQLSTGTHIFLDSIQNLISTILKVVDNAPINGETPIYDDFASLEICRLGLPPEVLIGVGLYACIHQGEYACVL